MGASPLLLQAAYSNIKVLSKVIKYYIVVVSRYLNIRTMQESYKYVYLGLEDGMNKESA